MKKVSKIIVLLLTALAITACSQQQPKLMGFYQSEITNDKCIQISIFEKENKFLEYIDNREVNAGTYVAMQDGSYEFNGDILNFNIKLNNNNTFELLLPKVNGDTPIILKYIDKIPAKFSTNFTDVEEYKNLLREEAYLNPIE